jgi:hypothetical protein
MDHIDLEIGSAKNMKFLIDECNQPTHSTHARVHARTHTNRARPITDCSGRTLEIGSAGILGLGEITFFPREISVIEMEEMMFLGHSFQSIAAGKLAFEPEKTEFDSFGAMQTSGFAKAEGERYDTSQNLALEGAISRMVTEQTHETVAAVTVPSISVIDAATCTSVPIFVADGVDKTSCHIMSSWNEVTNDTELAAGRNYYNLIQPPYRSGLGAEDRILLDDNYPNKYLHYDSIAWPSFCGMSATFAFWIENWGCGARAALLARYPTGTKTRDPGAWFYQIDQNPVGTKICIGQIPATGQVAHWRCVVSSVKLNCMEKLTRRHLAVVFDHLVNSIAFYVDGSLAGVLNSEVPDDKPWIRDSLGSGVGRLDCGFDTVAGYTALGHRVPGQQHYYGVIQD